MKHRGVLVGLVLSVLLVPIVFVVVRTVGISPPPVPTIRVERADFRVRLFAEGNLNAARNTPLVAPLKPRMAFTLAWLVDDGTLVSEGEVIARFDPSQLERNREDGLSDQRISDHSIGTARVRKEVKAGKLDRDADVAQQELEVATEFQSTDIRAYSKMDIIESQIDTELAETRAGHARRSQDIQGKLSETEIELLTIERRKADIKVQQADEGLAALEILAPHSGIVILERDWRGNTVRVGDSIWPGRTLGNIPDLAEMQAEVFVLEADAGDLETGQKATVWLEAMPEKEHVAVIKSVDPMASRRNRRVPVQYFRTILELEHTDPSAMKPGSRVRSEITIANLESAITIPRQAVCNIDGTTVVFRWERNEFSMVEVDLGPAALGQIVIESGIEEGDMIALRDPTVTDDTDIGGGDESSSPTLPGGPR